MNIVYLDASALIKRYVAETGSEWIHALLARSRTPTAFTSHLTVVEAACAFARRRREGSISLQDYDTTLLAFAHDIRYWYNILDLTPEVVDTAQILAHDHPLRAYDAIHLASAWLANRQLVRAGQSQLTFICADDRLLQLADAVGLSTDNPNQHPHLMAEDQEGTG